MRAWTSARRLLTRKPRSPFDEKAQKTIPYQQHLDRLGEIHFASLTKKEVEGMREVIEQLVRRLKDTLGRRYAAKKRGHWMLKKPCVGPPVIRESRWNFFFESDHRGKPKLSLCAMFPDRSGRQPGSC